jgi:hypothetical protein
MERMQEMSNEKPFQCAYTRKNLRETCLNL